MFFPRSNFPWLLVGDELELLSHSFVAGNGDAFVGEIIKDAQGVDGDAEGIKNEPSEDDENVSYDLSNESSEDDENDSPEEGEHEWLESLEGDEPPLHGTTEEDDEPVPTDGFFRWNEMEKVANDMEQSLEFEERAREAFASRHAAEKGTDDDFEDEEDGDIEYLDGTDDDDAAAGMMYSDFFNVTQSERPKPKSGPALGAREGTVKAPPLTKYEQQQQKVRDRIEEVSPISKSHRRLVTKFFKCSQLEATALDANPWTLAGEVDGKKRPENSLLELDAEWDTVRAANPELAVQRTESLEDMIKRRVLEDRFDSVMPCMPSHYSKKSNGTEELSHERSGVGLGEIYEKVKKVFTQRYFPNRCLALFFSVLIFTISTLGVPTIGAWDGKRRRTF
jgi:U3 small nucleolar RNA-associated protein MPP10